MSAITLSFDNFLDFSHADEIVLADTRIGLEQVIEAYEEGAGAEEIAWRYPAASLDQIHAAIAYYLSHRESVQTYLDRLRSPEVEPAKRLAAELRQKLEDRFELQVKDGRIRISRPS